MNGPGATDRDVLVAGVLHDVVEDTETSLDEVREAFGQAVADLVGWVGKPDPAPLRTRRRPACATSGP